MAQAAIVAMPITRQHPLNAASAAGTRDPKTSALEAVRVSQTMAATVSWIEIAIFTANNQYG